MNAIIKASSLVVTAILLSACGGGDDSPSRPQADFDDLRALKPSANYGAVIADCVSADDTAGTCSFEELPLIGMETTNPTIAEILDRTVVSHAWMGRRFEEVLNALPPAMLPIFTSVTAVVIDDDIRPSYYTNLTGAIYLDPAFLWLTPEEARTINTQEDFRAGFDDELAFTSLSRSIDNGARTARFGDINNPTARVLDDILYSTANLLLHELAHAHDFFPASEYGSLDMTSGPVFQSLENTSASISRSLTSSTPLTSDLLLNLGQVLYFGASASGAQKQFTPLQIGEEFEVDGAATTYGYSSRYEDVATLFDETMMKYFFNIDTDIAYTTSPTGDDARFCNFYVIKWGVRNRIGDERVKDRAQFVVEQILPNLPDSELFFQNLDAPTNLALDTNWCDTTTQIQADSGIQTNSKIQPLQLLRNEEIRSNH